MDEISLGSLRATFSRVDKPTIRASTETIEEVTESDGGKTEAQGEDTREDELSRLVIDDPEAYEEFQHEMLKDEEPEDARDNATRTPETVS